VAEYQVKKGDTVWRLTQDELEIPLWLLRDYNPQVDLFSLRPGDLLVYPIVVPTGGIPSSS
jgi:membrane-bound lytic murein transglycosylase D